jgi:hypothetical protein
MAGYSRDVIRDFAARFDSENPIAKAEEKARTVPGFGEEIHRVETEIGWLKGAFLHPPPAELEKLEAERRSLIVEALADEATQATTAVHPGGAQFKKWPRLALEEATRMWVEGAYEHSRNEIAKQVTKKVIADWDQDDLIAHGWDRKPFKFTRDAMNLVVDAIEDGLLEWDADRGLGVFRKFSATPEWLPIAHRKPAP